MRKIESVIIYYYYKKNKYLKMNVYEELYIKKYIYIYMKWIIVN